MKHRMAVQRTALALPICLATAALARPASPASSGEEPRVHEIRFDFKTQQPIAPISVNGGAPVPFLFDTGASINVVDQEIARQAALVGSGGRAMTGGGQATVEATFADSLTLSAGPISWERQRAAIIRLGYLDTKHYAGFIGAPILMQYVVQFDFDARIMRLIDPGAYQPPAGAVRVPFELQADLPVVRALVDAGAGPIEARLMVDTGAGDCFADLNRPFIDRHRLLDAMPNASPEARPAGIGGTAPFLYGIGKDLVLGGMVFDRPRLGLSRATQGSSSRSERDGIIGNELLRRFRATFDYRRRMLILERAPRRTVQVK